jgi:hypothetical protein
MAKAGEISVRIAPETKEFDNALKGMQTSAEKTKKKLEQINSPVKQIGRSIKQDVAGGLADATSKAGGLGKGLSAVFSGGLNPLTIYTAALAAVGGVFTNLMSKSQAFGDLFTKTMSQAGAVLSYVLDPSNWGSGFSEGLKKAVEAAGELADASDAVGTHLIEWQAKEARLNEVLADSQEIVNNQASTAQQRAEAIEKAQAAADEYAKSVKTLNDARRQELEMIIQDTAAQSRLSLSQEEVNYIIEKGVEDVDAMVAAGGNLAKFADAMSDDTHKKIVQARADIHSLEKASSDYAKRVSLLTKKETNITTKATVKIEPTLPEGSFASIRRQIADLSKQLELTIPGSLDAYKIQAEIDTLNDKLKGNEKAVVSIPVHLDVTDAAKDLKLIRKEEKEVADVSKELAKQMDGVGSIFGSFGQMVDAIGGESREAAVAVQALAIAQQVAAMASAIYNASKGEGYTTAARIIAAAAAVTSSMVAIHQLSRQSFAQGGIVQGTYQSGDREVINVNAGEMVLTKRQQGNLFNIIDKGDSGKGGQVTFKIEGRDLVGVLRAYNNYNGRTE